MRAHAAWNGRRPGSDGGTPTEKEGGQDRHRAEGPVRPRAPWGRGKVSEALDLARASHHENNVPSNDPVAFWNNNERNNEIEFFLDARD